MVSFLLSVGGSANATDMYGRVPLHWAAIKGCIEAAKALLEEGDGRLVHILFEDLDDLCPLYLAIYAGYHRCYHYLNAAQIHGRHEARRYLNFSREDEGRFKVAEWPGPEKDLSESLRELRHK